MGREERGAGGAVGHGETADGPRTLQPPQARFLKPACHRQAITSGFPLLKHFGSLTLEEEGTCAFPQALSLRFLRQLQITDLSFYLTAGRTGPPRPTTWGTFQALVVPSSAPFSLTPGSVPNWRSLERSCREL